VFIDRGSTSGLQRGMAVVTPDGIVGKVVAVYPLVAQVLLVTDATFKVGVESQKNHIHGVLDCGIGHCVVEQIQDEDKVDVGEWFYTSGEDRVFPRGFPVGTVTSNSPGQGMRDVKIALSGAPGGVEEVLIVLDGVHQEIPAVAASPEGNTLKSLSEPPNDNEKTKDASAAEQVQTEADKIVQKYQAVGKEEGHVYGAIGSGIPNFNVKPEQPAASAQATAAPVVSPKAAVEKKPDVELPLGAPRRKPASGTEQAAPPQP
jgi:rod shape-determining protein MreC